MVIWTMVMLQLGVAGEVNKLLDKVDEEEPCAEEKFGQRAPLVCTTFLVLFALEVDVGCHELAQHSV